MATKYGYVNRDPQNTQLNWNQIATDVTDMLQNEAKDREEKKSAIDQATREYQEVVNNVPQGENVELNKFALDAADKLQKQMLMQETLLKSGQLSPKDYSIMRQNLQDGTTQAFGLFEAYNKEYATKMAMNDPNLPVGQRASKLQNWLMENVESFANFSNHELVINPQTGLMSMAKLVDDGNGNLIPDDNPNNFVSVQSLDARIKGKYTQYDVIGNSEKFVSALGKQSEVMREIGKNYGADIFTKIKDITRRTGNEEYSKLTPAQKKVLAGKLGISVSDLDAYNKFDKAQTTFVRGELTSNPNFGASVILDFVGVDENGNAYEPTFDPNDKAPNKVLYKTVNGRVVAELTPEQLKIAEKAYKDQIDIGLDYEEEVTVSQVSKRPPVSRQRTTAEINLEETENLQKDVASALAKVYGGQSDQEIREGLTTLKSVNPNILGFDRAGTDLIIEFRDKDGKRKRETLKFRDAGNNVVAGKEYIQSSINFFLPEKSRVTDFDKIAQGSGVDFAQLSFNPTGAASLVQEDVKKIYSDGKKEYTLDEAVNFIMDKQLPPAEDIFIEDDRDAVAASVNALLAGSGYTAKVTGDYSDDIVSIFKDGKDTGLTFNVDDVDENKIKNYRDIIINLKKENMKDLDKARLAKGMRKEITRTSSLRKGGQVIGSKTLPDTSAGTNIKYNVVRFSKDSLNNQ